MRCSYAPPIDGSHDISPPAWNPALEAWPGGPHPGAIAEMEARHAKQERLRTAFLLLLCEPATPLRPAGGAGES